MKQDDVGMTNVNDADTDIPLAITNITTNGNARGINTALTQSGVRGESPIEPDSISKTS